MQNARDALDRVHEAMREQTAEMSGAACDMLKDVTAQLGVAEIVTMLETAHTKVAIEVKHQETAQEVGQTADPCPCAAS